jgi:hypothetical protein
METLALAAPSSFDLEYVADSGCPNEAAFKEMVVAELGYSPFEGDAVDRVVVRITRRSRTIDGRIEWRDSAGQWVGDQVLPLPGTDCGRAASAAAFALALQVQLLERRNAQAAPPEISVDAPESDGNEAEHSAPPLPPEEPQPPPVPAPLPEPEATSKTIDAAPSPPEPQFPFMNIGAGTSVGFGLASSPTLLGRIFGGVDWRQVAVELALEAGRPTATVRDDGAGFEQQRVAASGAACLKLSRWRTCLLANVGSVALAGRADQATSARVSIGELGFRIGAVQDLGRRLFLSANADGVVTLNRWTATLDRRPLWTAPRFSAALGVGIGVHFR